MSAVPHDEVVRQSLDGRSYVENALGERIYLNGGFGEPWYDHPEENPHLHKEAAEILPQGSPGSLSPNRRGTRSTPSDLQGSPGSLGSPYATGDGVLSAVEHFISEYVAFPSDHALVATVLWAAHSHTVDSFESSPRLALLSPEPGSGKTRALEVLELLCPVPMHVLSASPSAIFRSITDNRPTLLCDEVDAIFGRHGKDDGAEDLRGLLNAGHRRGATIPRCVGPTHAVHQFKVYAAVALAGLGDLPETLMSRSVVIRMRRRAPGEKVTPFRHRIAAPTGHAIREQLNKWVLGHVDDLADAWPAMPDGVTDRPADVWEPLLAIADAAGGEWPNRAGAACVELTKASIGRDASLGIRLLTDLRTIFGDNDRMSTEVILTKLCALEESPWSNLRGSPLDARGLAHRLGAYEVSSLKVKVDGKALKGYRREDLWDAWERYCPSDSAEGEPGEPGEPGCSEALFEVPLDLERGEPEEPNAIRGLRDLPFDTVGTCRACRDTCATGDEHGPIHKKCKEMSDAP
jgi:hypothetical protein